MTWSVATSTTSLTTPLISYNPATAAFSAYADPIPASGPLHLLFLPFKLYLPRACSFSTLKANSNVTSSRKSPLPVLGDSVIQRPTLAILLWANYLIFLCISFLTCKIGML